MSVDLNLGDTRTILSACMSQGLLRNQAAYVLATAYWETARTMKPVEEAFWLSDEWRKNNLRYYPWHGRGYVQITWETNYHKASKETGADLIADPTKAMQSDIAAQILVVGSRDGWFTGKKLSDYITLEASNFTGARRIINGTDKASTISEIARDYDEALLSEGYGVEPEIPVVNEGRDGKQPRKSIAQSTTVVAVGAIGVVNAPSLSPELMESINQLLLSTGASAELIQAAVTIAAAIWAGRERKLKWNAGDR